MINVDWPIKYKWVMIYFDWLIKNIKWDGKCEDAMCTFVLYSLRPKLYDVLGISHILRNVINIVWEIDIMSCFTKLPLINYMGKINEWIERRE